MSRITGGKLFEPCRTQEYGMVKDTTKKMRKKIGQMQRMPETGEWLFPNFTKQRDWSIISV
jgi:hypothetical protein